MSLECELDRLDADIPGIALITKPEFAYLGEWFSDQGLIPKGLRAVVKEYSLAVQRAEEIRSIAENAAHTECDAKTGRALAFFRAAHHAAKGMPSTEIDAAYCALIRTADDAYTEATNAAEETYVVALQTARDALSEGIRIFLAPPPPPIQALQPRPGWWARLLTF